MEEDSIINDKVKKLNTLKNCLNDIDAQLLSLTKDLNWDYNKLLNEDSKKMETCSVNTQHRVPSSKLKEHEKRCQLRQEGYFNCDKFFPEYSGHGSFITLTSEKLKSITDDVSSNEGNKIRQVPQTSANFDVNFNREEKLAIYDYVISNTIAPKSFSDLHQPFEEKKKKEMTEWEIAAAERDAKRRRASYRNKVHTNRKTQTEILREIIQIQMEYFKEQSTNNENPETVTKNKNMGSEKEKRYEPNYSHNDIREETSSKKNEGHRHKSKRDNEHSNHKSSHTVNRSHSDSRSRSHDKYRKWKDYEGRSHSHKSGHSRRKS